jgi:2-haloacid dehalogenase
VARKITTVVFDFGNVLITWDMRLLFADLIDDSDELDRFLSEVWTPERNAQCDRGRPYDEVIAELVADHPDFADVIPEYSPARRWLESIGPPVAGAGQLVADLDEAGYRLAGLSNFSAETFPLIRDAHPVFDRFEDIVISGEHGVTKPDPAIFELVCERGGFSPAEAVFIDDSSANTAAAADFGFSTVTFTDTPSARDRLRDLGVSN